MITTWGGLFGAIHHRYGQWMITRVGVEKIFILDLVKNKEVNILKYISLITKIIVNLFSQYYGLSFWITNDY